MSRYALTGTTASAVPIVGAGVSLASPVAGQVTRFGGSAPEHG